MKQKFIHYSRSLTSISSRLLYPISFIPFLYPIVLPFSIFCIIFIAFLLYYYRSEMDTENKVIFVLSLRKSFLALLINAGLFLALFLHSWFCYTRTLHQEIEPFREMIKDSTGLNKPFIPIT